MKRYFVTTSLIFIFITAMIPSIGSAVEMSAGVSTWYAWWDYIKQDDIKAEVDPTLLYGPALSLKINDDFNLTFLFLYGKFNVDQTDLITSEKYSYDVKRFDSDNALNYRINNYCKFYIGAKYSSYSFDIATSGWDSSMEHNSFGPATGISAVFPLSNDFFIIGNLGGFYLWGNEENSGSGYSETSKGKDYGLNSTLSIAYYINSASTTISLGGRYQYLKMDYEDQDTTDTKFYGITLSATYSFSI